jgi:hypothetical protein
MTDPVTEVKTVVADAKATVATDEAKVQGFFAKQVAWVKANPIKTGVAGAGVVAVLAKLFL